MKQKESAILGQILMKIAPLIGAVVLIEPEYGVVSQVTFKSGKRIYFRYNTTDLNPMGASEIARDKDYANYFLRSMGYPIVPGSKTFFSQKWANAIRAINRNIDSGYEYARTLGFPVIVKPNSGSQGVGVTKVHNKREFYSAVRAIFTSDRIVLVQKPVVGRDYRLVVLDNKIISAYERIPLNVVGDGISTIGELLILKQENFVASSRDTQIKLDDPRIRNKLLHHNLTLDFRPAIGERIFLLDNANLSTGGDSVDVTADVHPAFKEIAINITRDMGLRLCGVDLMVEGEICNPPNIYWVLEINSAPGLDHYARIGKSQEKIVEDLYLEVLKHMDI